jgi:hypothetical protein
MRTTTWQIVRLAWRLWRRQDRAFLRIGQMIWNAHCRDPFYIENEVLLRGLRR